MTSVLIALGLLAVLIGFGVFVMWDVDRLIDRLESEANTFHELHAVPACSCRSSARCLSCIERDGLTKAAA